MERVARKENIFRRMHWGVCKALPIAGSFASIGFVLGLFLSLFGFPGEVGKPILFFVLLTTFFVAWGFCSAVLFGLIAGLMKPLVRGKVSAGFVCFLIGILEGLLIWSTARLIDPRTNIAQLIGAMIIGGFYIALFGRNFWEAPHSETTKSTS